MNISHGLPGTLICLGRFTVARSFENVFLVFSKLFVFVAIRTLRRDKYNMAFPQLCMSYAEINIAERKFVRGSIVDPVRWDFLIRYTFVLHFLASTRVTSDICFCCILKCNFVIFSCILSNPYWRVFVIVTISRVEVEGRKRIGIVVIDKPCTAQQHVRCRALRLAGGACAVHPVNRESSARD